MHISPGTRRGAALLAAATAVALLAACSSSTKGTPNSAATSGGSGTSAAPAQSTSSTASSPATSSAASTATSTAAAASAPGKQALSAMVLQASDLPAGWKASPASSSSSSDPAQQAAFANCVGVRNTEPDKVAEADSSSFSQQNASIGSNATSYRSPSDITTDASVFQKADKATACFKKLAMPEFKKGMPKGTSIDNVSMKVVPGSNGGPNNVVGRLTATITVKTSGMKVPVYIDTFFIAGKQVEAEVDFENVGQPIDSSLQNKLVTAVAQRVANG